MSTTSEPQPDPGGAQTAIDRYRELAKYLITIFAAVAGLLLAGTQLASIGKLSWDDEAERVVAAGIGITAGLSAVAWIVVRALEVLRPVEMSLEQLLRDSKLTADIEALPTLLQPASSVRELQEWLDGDMLEPEERAVWVEAAEDVTARAAYRTVEQRFKTALRDMLLAAIVGTAGIVAFAWGANPPDDESAAPVVQPVPAIVTVSLTASGREALRDALGRACSAGRFRALAIGGTESRPRIVALPERGCRQTQFLLPAAWGAAAATRRAPTR